MLGVAKNRDRCVLYSRALLKIRRLGGKANAGRSVKQRFICIVFAANSPLVVHANAPLRSERLDRARTGRPNARGNSVLPKNGSTARTIAGVGPVHTRSGAEMRAEHLAEVGLRGEPAGKGDVH